MCGICGVVGADGADVAKRVRKMMNALVHRGPDGEGVLDRAGVIFGIRRLSIIDFSSGQQPIYNETGDVGVVFNGEIYNFLQLRATLESRGHRFNTRCDTEIIVHAYEEWGDRCVEHLDGMFSFALWDGRNSGASLSGSYPKKGRVLLARDRLGIKPLYYALATDVLIFASELRALLASEAVERRLAPQSIEAYLLFGSVVEPMTLVEGVYSLPSGHSLALNLDVPIDPDPMPYWELSFRANQKARQAPRALAPAGHGVRALLEKAVASQLLADVPVGVFLSSGLDSTAVAAVAARNRAGVQTFTMSFLEQNFDEASWARNTARQLGTEHHELILTGEEMQTQLFEAIGALDQPSMDGVNTFFLSWGARRAGLKVALSGLGGDELFGGYPSFRLTPQLAKIMAIAGWLPERARNAISLALLEIGRRAGIRERADRLRKVASIFSHPAALPDAYFLNRILFTPRQTERLLSPSIIAMRSEAAHSERISWRRWLEQLVVYAETLRGESAISYLELRTYMLNTLLRDTDSMSMHHSLEVRVPLLDHELVEYVEALPDGARKKAGTTKALLAESVKDLLPGGAVHRPKRAFTLPWEHWLRGKAGTEVACRLGMLTPSLASMLDSNAVQSVWRRFLSKRTGWARPWSLFVLNEWARKHIDEVESDAKLTDRPAAEAAAS